jgi:hypothetical protein
MMFHRGGIESGLNILPHRGNVRRVIEALRSGEIVVVLTDQQGFLMHRKLKRKAKRAKKNGFSPFKPSRLQHDT